MQLGVNPMIEAAEFSVPVAPDAALFGTLADARRLIRADQLPAALDGGNVNVVVIDAGIDQSMIPPPGKFGGWWLPMPGGPGPPPPPPGMTTGLAARHGTMVVNNILAMAPKATIFDVPLIRPPKIGDIPPFLALADATYRRILRNIFWFRRFKCFTGPWIFMNAWTIYDRRSEVPFLGEYTENLGANGITPHPFNKLIEKVSRKNFDIVFCAGNCGRICPDGRCGANDYGPGRSIWGANAHRNVLSVGAVRVDGIWLGYSSEGPGPLKLDQYKPDLCAPSQFEGTQGEYPSNTGTSAAAAISAGIIAALRSRPNWNQTAVSPTALKQILNATATKTQGAGWNQTIGNGILNANAAAAELSAQFP